MPSCECRAIFLYSSDIYTEYSSITTNDFIHINWFDIYTMLFSITLWVTLFGPIVTALAPPSSPSYHETLTTQGLIGDHFGIPGFPKTFDYIIVGGGTAGNTMARRLAADCKFSVALIEAGGFYETDNGNWSEIPANAINFIEPQPVIRNNLIDWYQFTTPQEVSQPTFFLNTSSTQCLFRC